MSERRLLLAAGLPLYVAVVLALSTWALHVIWDPIEGLLAGGLVVLFLADFELSGWYWWTYCGLPALLLVASQVIFLAPAMSPAGARPPRGRRAAAVVPAGFVGGVLTTALVFSLLQLQRDLLGWFTLEAVWPLWRLHGLLAVSWVVRSFLFHRAVRGRSAGPALERMMTLLRREALLVSLVVLPIDVAVHQDRMWYLFSFSYHALWLWAWVLLWLPAPSLCLGWRRRQEATAVGSCERCGYDKGPAPGARCPECGHQWLAADAARPGPRGATVP